MFGGTFFLNPQDRNDLGKNPQGTPMKPEELQALQQQITLQQQQLEQERQKQELEKSKQLELTYNPIVETEGPDGKKTIGLREELQLRSPEEFITAEKGRMGLAQTQAADQLNRALMQQQAQQRAAAMARSGVRGGTGALDRFSMREAMLGKQNLAGQGLKQQADFASQAEQLRSEARAKQVGLLGGAIKDVEKFNLDRWMKLKEVEAAKVQAQATRDAGKDTTSCWVISELAKHVKIPRDQGKLLTKMKVHFALNNLKLSVFYIRKCHTLIDKMNEANFNWVEFKWFNDSLVSLLRSGEYEAASALFKSTVVNLIKEFWPECSDRSYLKAVKEQEKKLEEMLSIKNKYEDTVLEFECLSNLPEISFEGSK